MEKKIRQEILGDKADEIREEIWQKERYAERESINLVKNEKIKEKLIELFTAIQIAREERESIIAIDIFTEEEKAIKERLDKLN